METECYTDLKGEGRTSGFPVRASLHERDSPVIGDSASATGPIKCLGSCCLVQIHSSLCTTLHLGTQPPLTLLMLSLFSSACSLFPQKRCCICLNKAPLAEAQAGAGKPALLPPHSYPKAASSHHGKGPK